MIKKLKNIFIILIGIFLVNIIFYFLNIKLGYENKVAFFSIITIYTLLTIYNYIYGNIKIFNKIYSFVIGLFGLFLSWSSEYYTVKDKENSFKQIRTLDIYNSKLIYFVGNITILVFLYFIFNIIVGENPNIIFLVLLIFGLVFPIFYVSIYETLLIKNSKVDSLKLILMIILIIITVIVLFCFKNVAFIILLYFLLLVSLIASIDNKKLFITNLILLVIFVIVPLFVILCLAYKMKM